MTGVIDCDVHTNLPSVAAFAAYLPERWRHVLTTYGLRRPGEVAEFPTRPRAYASRTDSVPPSGGPPGSEVDFTREQLLDAWDLDFAIINPIPSALFGGEPGDYGTALIRAVNEWTLAEWLEPEPRLRGSICVGMDDPAAAAAEIARAAADDRFVQVLVNLRTREPLGTRRYWPIYEAACEHGLPLAAHVGGPSVNPYSTAGSPSYYFEYHAGYPQGVHGQVVSLIAEGVFEAFPSLQFVVQEGGFAWLPALMWRMDRSWRQLGDELPHLRHEPSHYIREHFYFTTQPVEEPERPAQFGELLEDMALDERLLFATDYPHWDFDAPDSAIPRSVPEATRRAILGENAARLYGLTLS